MNRCYGLLCLATSIVLSSSLFGIDAKDDLKKFEGVWHAVRAEKEGKPLPDEKLKEFRVTFNGTKITIKDGKDEDVATFTIDASKSPGFIDFTPVDDKKMSAPGIYAFEGETLKVCWSRVGGERPKDFASKAETETRFFILTRAK